MRRSNRQQRRACKHAQRSADHSQPAFPSRVMQLIEEEKSPKDAEQAIRVPQGKCDAKANVADGVDRKGIGDSPHASREYRPDDQMWRLTNVCFEVRRTADERWHAPACQEDSTHHDQRDGDWRNVGIHQLDRSLSATKPGTGSKSAENSQSLQAAKTGNMNYFNSGCSILCQRDWIGVQRSLSNSASPPRRTLSGIQK